MKIKGNFSLQFWIVHIIGWVLFSMADFYRNHSENAKEIEYYYWTIAMLMGFLTTLILRFIYRELMIKYKPSYQKIIVLFIGSVLGSATWVSSHWLIRGCVEWYNDQFQGYFNFMVEHEFSTFYFLKRILDATYPMLAWSLLYFGIKTWIDLQTESKKREQALLLVQQAQLQMLRYQINPHFLFNSLNSIQALIYEDQKMADKMISELSDFLRYSLNSNNQNFLTFEEEFEITKKYLNIEKTRFEEKLDLEFAISKKCMPVIVPGFFMQPIIENAIKHGIKTSPIPLRINIEAKIENTFFCLVIKNSGRWIEGNENGIGLRNVKKRLENIYNTLYHFSIVKDEQFVEIRIKIPTKV